MRKINFYKDGLGRWNFDGIIQKPGSIFMKKISETEIQFMRSFGGVLIKTDADNFKYSDIIDVNGNPYASMSAFEEATADFFVDAPMYVGGINPVFPDVLLDGNTVAWYDSTDITTIEKNSTNLVSKWKDKLGSGRDLAQATDSKKPRYESGNGIHFNFDSIDDKMNASFTYAQPAMMYIVMKDNVRSSGGRFADGYSGNSAVIGDNTGLAAFAGTAWTTSSLNMEVNSWIILRVLFNGANSKLIVNRSISITGDIGSASPSGFTLGNRGDATAAGEDFTCREVILRKKADSQIDEDAIYNYLVGKYSLKEVIILGDSTSANNYSQKAIWELMTSNVSCIDNSIGSSTISAQKTRLLQTASSKTNAVIIIVGLNDLNQTTTDLINNYQNLINVTRSVIGTDGIIIINTMIPCNLKDDPQYIALNDSILGVGQTPITGADVIINTVDTVLNSGDGTLNPIYGIGDGLHENNAGRQVIATLWDNALKKIVEK